MSAKRLLSTNDSQQKLIREGVAGNLELQTIVLNVIQDYKAEQVARAGAVAGSSGTRCEQLVEKRKLAGKKISANATMAPPAPRRPQAQLSDDPGVILNPEKQPPKNCKKYAGWKPDLLLELFEYAESSLFSAAQKSVDGRKLTRQLFEYAFGLKAGAIPEEVSKCDRPATLDKVRTFAALRALYIANGRLFRSLELTDGGVDWFKAGQGVYELQASSGGGDTPSGAAAPAPGAAALFVFDRISRRKAPVDPTLVGVQGPGEFLKLKIRFDFSLSSARIIPEDMGAVQNPGELLIVDLFPRSIRCVRRVLSDSLEAAKYDEPAIKRARRDLARSISDPLSAAEPGAAGAAAAAAASPEGGAAPESGGAPAPAVEPAVALAAAAAVAAAAPATRIAEPAVPPSPAPGGAGAARAAAAAARGDARPQAGAGASDLLSTPAALTSPRPGGAKAAPAAAAVAEPEPEDREAVDGADDASADTLHGASGSGGEEASGDEDGGGASED